MYHFLHDQPVQIHTKGIRNYFLKGRGSKSHWKKSCWDFWKILIQMPHHAERFIKYKIYQKARYINLWNMLPFPKTKGKNCLNKETPGKTQG